MGILPNVPLGCKAIFLIFENTYINSFVLNVNTSAMVTQGDKIKLTSWGWDVPSSSQAGVKLDFIDSELNNLNSVSLNWFKSN